MNDSSPNVTATFGPPVHSGELQKNMGQIINQIAAKSNAALVLPFVDQLKVTDGVQGETSMFNVIIKCKATFFELHTRNVHIVRELLSYASLQQTLLPVVNTKEGLTVASFLQTMLLVAEQNKRKAASLRSDTEANCAEMRQSVECLTKDLDQVSAEIVKNQSALEAAQKEYDSARAAATFNKLLGALYTGAALAALANGQGTLALNLFDSSYSSFSQAMDTFVVANKLSQVIANFKKVIRTTQDTRKHLRELVALLSENVEHMQQLNCIWEGLTGKLNDIQASLELWSRDGVVAPATVQGAVEAWKIIEEECNQYYKTLAASDTTSTDNGATNAAHRLAPLEHVESAVPPLGVNEAVRVVAIARAQVSDGLVDALSAPRFTLGVGRAQLAIAASEYHEAANALRADYADSAQSSGGLSQSIETQLMPALNAAVAYFKTFAKDQKQLLAQGLGSNQFASLLETRHKQISQGGDLTRAAENVFINFRQAAQLALDQLVAHLGELQMKITIQEASVRDAQAKYDQWKWAMHIPLPLPLTSMTLGQLVKAMTDTTRDLANFRVQLGRLQQAQSRVVAMEQQLAQVGAATSGLSQGWAALTTKTEVLQVFLKASQFAPQPVMMPLIGASWEALITALSQW